MLGLLAEDQHDRDEYKAQPAHAPNKTSVKQNLVGDFLPGSFDNRTPETITPSSTSLASCRRPAQLVSLRSLVSPVPVVVAVERRWVVLDASVFHSEILGAGSLELVPII
ncbi:MAG: hypothetical protein AAGI30_14460 [Planctomycetota bacterium]